MPLSAVLAFWAVAALLILVPGPDWAFAISAGLRGRVVPAAAGIVLGYVAMTTLVAAGLGLLIASTSTALTALTVVGGSYLIWLGVRTVTSSPTLNRDSRVDGGDARATLLEGVAVSGLNPKALLIFVALLPQFASPRAAWPVAVQLVVLGGVFALTCGLVYLAVGSAARVLLQARPATARVVSRVSGASMVALGALLLAEALAR